MLHLALQKPAKDRLQTIQMKKNRKRDLLRTHLISIPQ
uniref:Uncharacterized protein n=1 Tax=Anguilla anguilla TaxID=7936 RepID=A0A0E9XUR5_ANGAN